jgi:hypothetical protein
MVAAGFYDESITIENGNDINLYGGYDGNNWSAPRDLNANLTVIDASGLDNTVVYINNVNVVIDGFTITNGLADDNGGGIYCEHSNLQISNCIITGNRTADGEDNSDINGGNGGNGGGVYCTSSAITITDSSITANTTGNGGETLEYWFYGGNGGNGAGVYCSYSSLMLDNSNISGNISGRGGTSNRTGSSGSGAGVFCVDSSPTIKNCTIIENRTGEGIFSGSDEVGDSGDGGGIALKSCSQAVIQNCIIANNATGDVAIGGYFYGGSGGSGAGVYSSSSSPTIKNCLVLENSAGDGGPSESFGGNGGSGAGIYCNGSPQIINCTIVGNITGIGGENWGGYDGTDGIGGGIFATGSMMVTNTIIWDNSLEQLVGQDCNNVTYCDIGDNTCVDGIGNISIDPCFVDPDGGDYHLKSQGWRWNAALQEWDFDRYTTSRCIDAGNPSSPLGEELLSVPSDPNNDWGENLRINMGAYGGTAEASIPPHDWAILSDITNDGIANFADFSHLGSLYSEKGDKLFADFDRDGDVDTVDLSLFCEDWLK